MRPSYRVGVAVGRADRRIIWRFLELPMRCTEGNEQVATEEFGTTDQIKVGGINWEFVDLRVGICEWGLVDLWMGIQG